MSEEELKQTGGDGYTFNLGENVGGLPPVEGYNCCDGAAPPTAPADATNQVGAGTGTVGDGCYDDNECVPELDCKYDEDKEFAICTDPDDKPTPKPEEDDDEVEVEEDDDEVEAPALENPNPDTPDTPEVPDLEAGPKPKGDNLEGKDTTPAQGGGINPFNFIINPQTGARMSLFSSGGKTLLRNLIKLYKAGGAPKTGGAPAELPGAFGEDYFNTEADALKGEW